MLYSDFWRHAPVSRVYPAAISSAQYLFLNSVHLPGSCPNDFRKVVLGAILFSHSSICASFFVSPQAKAINQDTIAIGFGTLIINAFDSHAHARLSQQRLHLVVANQAQLEI